MKRFALTLKWDVISNWKDTLKIMLTLAFGLLLMFATSLLTRRGVALTGELIEQTVKQLAAFSWFIFAMSMLVGASRIFFNMKTKQQRTAFLMLPASNAEKFVARWLWATVGQAALFFISLAVADLLQMFFRMLIGVGVFGSVTLEMLRIIGEIMSGGVHEVYEAVDCELGTAVTISVFVTTLSLFTHAWYVLGGTFFRRNHWLLATCAGFIVMFLISAVCPESVLITLMTVKEDVLLKLNVGSGVLFVLTVAAYWRSYLLFKRMQVINNKWTNV